jgi:hypothetical protein
VNITDTKFHENIPVAVALIQADQPTTGDMTQIKGIFSDYAKAALLLYYTDYSGYMFRSGSSSRHQLSLQDTRI